MIQLTRTWAIALGILISLGLAGCDPPEDALSAGALCTSPNTSCPTQVEVSRATPFGRNAVDLTVFNQGTSNANITVYAGPSDLFTAGIPVVDPSDSDDDGIYEFFVQRTYTLGPNTSQLDRFLPTQLGRSKSITIAMRCEPTTASQGCDAALEYVVLLEANECRANEDCDGRWICDTTRGECVECLDVSQCELGQSCELGRCKPERVTSCAHAPTRAPLSPTPLLPVAFIGAALWWRKRKGARAAMASAAVLLCTTLGGTAHAQVVATPRAYVHVGAGGAQLTGEVGALANTGISMTVAQELRGMYVGMGLYLGAAYFTTTQPSPPTSKSLITYSAQLTPTLYYRIGPAELFARGGYERMGVAANSLIRTTGPELSYNAFVAGAGAQWALDPLSVRAEFVWHTIGGFPGSMMGINLLVGFGSS